MSDPRSYRSVIVTDDAEYKSPPWGAATMGEPAPMLYALCKLLESSAVSLELEDGSHVAVPVRRVHHIAIMPEEIQ